MPSTGPATSCATTVAESSSSTVPTVPSGIPTRCLPETIHFLRQAETFLPLPARGRPRAVSFSSPRFLLLGSARIRANAPRANGSAVAHQRIHHVHRGDTLEAAGDEGVQTVPGRMGLMPSCAAGRLWTWGPPAVGLELFVPSPLPLRNRRVGMQGSPRYRPSWRPCACAERPVLAGPSTSSVPCAGLTRRAFCRFSHPQCRRRSGVPARLLVDLSLRLPGSGPTSSFPLGDTVEYFFAGTLSSRPGTVWPDELPASL